MRIKRGVTKRQAKKKVLSMASGYRMTYHKLYRRAKEAILHSGQYSYAHRRRRRSQMKVEWVQTIAAALSTTPYSYSQFISKMKENNITIDRKNIAELIVYNPNHFQQLLKEIEK